VGIGKGWRGKNAKEKNRKSGISTAFAGKRLVLKGDSTRMTGKRFAPDVRLPNEKKPNLFSAASQRREVSSQGVDASRRARSAWAGRRKGKRAKGPFRAGARLRNGEEGGDLAREDAMGEMDDRPKKKKKCDKGGGERRRTRGGKKNAEKAR